MVKTALEIVEYYQPAFWFLENPRYGDLSSREYMRDIPYVDMDYCKFSNWGYKKPTRFLGPSSIQTLEPRLCKKDCQNMIWQETTDGPRWVHRYKLGVAPEPGDKKPTGEQAGRIPAALIHYLLTCQPGLIPAKPSAQGTAPPVPTAGGGEPTQENMGQAGSHGQPPIQPTSSSTSTATMGAGLGEPAEGAVRSATAPMRLQASAPKSHQRSRVPKKRGGQEREARS